MIRETWPAVVPVCIDGMDKVLPIGSSFPRFFKRIYIYFGRPLDLSEFKGRKTDRETAQEVIDKVMEAIRALKIEIQKMKAQR